VTTFRRLRDAVLILATIGTAVLMVAAVVRFR
jgi:hypothetical protein